MISFPWDSLVSLCPLTFLLQNMTHSKALIQNLNPSLIIRHCLWNEQGYAKVPSMRDPGKGAGCQLVEEQAKE